MNRLISHPVRSGTRLVEAIRQVGVSDLTDDYWVAGGAARAVYLNQEVRNGGDIDVFSANKEAADFVIGRLHERTRIKGTAQNAHGTQTFDCHFRLTPFNSAMQAKFQVIGSTWASPSVEQLLDRFDFTVCQFATDGYTVIYPEQAARDARDGVLRVQPMKTGGIRPLRLIKYLNQGFEPDSPLLVKALHLDDTSTPVGQMMTINGSGY